MRKVISCCLVTAFVGSLAYVMTQPVALERSGQAAKPDAGTRLLQGVGAAVALVLPVACGGGGGGPTPPNPPPRTFTSELSRSAIFTGTAGTGRHEVQVAAAGILEATFTADRTAILRLVAPSGRVVESGPGTVHIPAEPGRWVFSVARSEGGEPAGYRLHVLFP